ncbi:MAG: hypothetical protein EA360_04685 [Balneolaceae bacterium]|nr:MAG: hypothetical protein EA360_04685 [Balneolaceae bacterium]
MKIGYLYYNFFPVEGGAAIHGYHLAKELSFLGHRLYKLNGESDPYTNKLSNPVAGFLWMLRNCDLFYVRMDFFLKPRNMLVLLLILFRKKIVVELNTPSDELLLHGKSNAYISVIDTIYSKILKRADAVIVVSAPIENYCRKQLGLENVFVIENGANRFRIDEKRVSPGILCRVKKIKDEGQKLVIWSGSVNKLQDIELLTWVIKNVSDGIIFYLIVKEEDDGLMSHFENANINVFRKLDRQDVEFIISNADAGLAFYGDYSWCRWGFYNSSLKTFEYLSNGLITISNKSGSEIQKSHPNYHYIGDPEEIRAFISDLPESQGAGISRSWKDVASETDKILNEVVHF